MYVWDAGVPLIGIPMFADQYLNIQKAVSNGYAFELDFKHFTEETILEAIRTVIGDPK